MDLWNANPDDLLRALDERGVTRAFILKNPESGALETSNPVLDGIAKEISRDARDYHGHEAIFLEIGAESGHLLGAFIHLTHRGQGAGGVRLWTYDTVEEFIRDGLRLSRGMGHKNALAGLWWGGGKGVIARRHGIERYSTERRAAIFRDYGRFVSGLRGCYVAAEDVGTTPEDMAWVFRTTRFATCIPPDHGGSGNPSRLTARGVVVAMEAALAHRDEGTLGGKTVAIQGLGNVASFMIAELIERGVGRMVGVDIDARVVAARRSEFEGAPVEFRHVARDDTTIFSSACDIFSPNAVGGCLNPETIALLQADIVCGGANNQLEDPARDAPLLTERGILYVPDFLANRMGIVNCANEQYGVFPDDPAVEEHLSRDSEHGVYRRCLDVFRRAAEERITTASAAERIADELSLHEHPIWPGRTRAIVASLIRDDWVASRAPVGHLTPVGAKRPL